MARIYIYESGIGNVREPVRTYEDLERHHPSRGDEYGRVYETIDGELEEVRGDYKDNVFRTRDGNLMVSKDFVLHDGNQDNKEIPVPAPASGYIGRVDEAQGLVDIYDQPGGELIARIRHMDLSNTNLQVGDQVEYGQPLGMQGNAGSKDIHVHIDFNAQYLDQFRKYISDIDAGVISTDSYPAQAENLRSPTPVTGMPSALADGGLRPDELGIEVRRLQQQLTVLGFAGADGQPLVIDGRYGNNTAAAVQAYQRARNLPPTGTADAQTLQALAIEPAIRLANEDMQITPPGATETTVPPETVPSETVPPVASTETPPPAVSAEAPASAPPATASDTSTASAEAAATSVLSNLIGSGEGNYNSYNQGTAGDAPYPINLTDLTVGEIMRRQRLPADDPDYLFAVGKFQMVGPPWNTFEETVNALGIDHNAKFTPELQEYMFAEYLIDEKRPAINDYITGVSSGEEGLLAAQHALAQEWAAVKDPFLDNAGNYDEIAGNAATISLQESADALNSMREQYAANIASGMSPEEAYAGLRDQPPNAEGQGVANARGALDDNLLRERDRGEEVVQLQTQLNQLGFTDAEGNRLDVDGVFGERTRQAVEAFQREHGLDVDGIVGPVTHAVLSNVALPATDSQTVTTQPVTGGASEAPITVETLPPVTGGAAEAPITAETLPPVTGGAAEAPITVETLPPPATTLPPQSSGDIQLPVDPPAPPALPSLPAFPNIPEENSATGDCGLPSRTNTQTLLSDPSHPDHALYAQAMAALEKLPEGTFKNAEERQNAAGMMAFEAKLSGMSRIDSAVLSTNGMGLIAVQGDPSTHNYDRVYVDKAQAAAQSLEKTTEQFQQEIAARAVDRPAEQPENQRKPSPIMVA